MKKLYIAMAALAAVTLISCEREKSFDDTPLEKNEFRLALHGSASTRSAELMEPKKFTFFAGKDAKTGESFYLEEVVEDLNYTAPATKGTPAYTENVGKLYHNLNVVAKGGENDITTMFWAMDGEQQEDAGWRYRGMFEWEQDSYDFYMSMPEDMTSKGVSNLTYDNKTIRFKYTAPENSTAQDLQDLIFAARTITKSEAQANRVNGVPVLFHHALTGVKFRIANNDELEHGKEGRTQTYITKVTITGLKDSGTCTITPREETNGYVDDRTGDYSSGDKTFTDGVVAWTYDESTDTFSQEFTEAQNLTKYSGSTTTEGEDGTSTTTSGSFQNNGNYPDSFSNAGATYNLNDADASMTFWFIPQALTADVKITVEFHVWAGDETEETKTLTLKLGEKVLEKEGTDLALTRDWKAGQLRTFSLKPLTVDVDIRDEMDEYVKSDVYIKNTGNVTEYVRVYIIANWVGYRMIDAENYNSYESVLMGYTDAEVDEHGVYANHDEVARWNDKDFTGTDDNKVYEPWYSPSGGPYPYTPYGDFVGLPPMGTKTAGGTMVNNWIRHDKFYYYTLPIGPGEDVPDTDPLFKSYTVGESPDFWIADNTGVRRLAKDVHLVMDLAVQGVPAVDADGNALTYLQAWTAALNPDNDPDFNINDL
jgi:hypothetical protein